jgi:hypothetical protein
MGTSLINTKPKNNYGSLIKVGDNLPIDGTLKTISDGAGNDTPLQLSLTEVQVNSIFRINTNNTELLDIQDVGGNNRFNINRNVQKINLDFSSNPASSTELIGAIRTYADGVNLSDAISFIKDGSIGMGTQSPVGLLHLKKTGATTRLAIDGDAGQSRILSYRTGGVQRFGLYTNNTPETGSNVGSDFALRAYSDAGTLLSTALFVKRSTGFVGIGNTSPTHNLQVTGTGRFGNILVGSGNTQITATGTAATLNFASNGIGIAGATPLTPTARFQIQGTGATSATTSLLVQNSAATNALKLDDDGTFTLGAATLGAGAISVFNGTDLLMTRQGTVTILRTGSGGQASVGTQNNLQFGIRQNNLVKMTFDANGNVLVNPAAQNSVANVSAQLQIDSTSKGFLPPRMTTAEKTSIGSPVAGLMVYDTTLNKLCVFTNLSWETITSI